MMKMLAKVRLWWMYFNLRLSCFLLGHRDLHKGSGRRVCLRCLRWAGATRG